MYCLSSALHSRWIHFVVTVNTRNFFDSIYITEKPSLTHITLSLLSLHSPPLPKMYHEVLCKWTVIWEEGQNSHQHVRLSTSADNIQTVAIFKNCFCYCVRQEIVCVADADPAHTTSPELGVWRILQHYTTQLQVKKTRVKPTQA